MVFTSLGHPIVFSHTRVHAECNSILLYTQPGLVYYTQPGVRILRLLQKKWTRILLVHSYIDRRYVFFLPLCLLASYQHNQCEFVLKSG
jgi:hypothetical protein